MTSPNISQEMTMDLQRWGELTINICRRFGTPPAEEQLLMHYCLVTMHSDRYHKSDLTHVNHLVVLLFNALQKAQRKPRPLPYNLTTIMVPPNRTWYPLQTCVDPWPTASHVTRAEPTVTQGNVTSQKPLAAAYSQQAATTIPPTFP